MNDSRLIGSLLSLFQGSPSKNTTAIKSATVIENDLPSKYCLNDLHMWELRKPPLVLTSREWWKNTVWEESCRLANRWWWRCAESSVEWKACCSLFRRLTVILGLLWTNTGTLPQAGGPIPLGLLYRAQLYHTNLHNYSVFNEYFIHWISCVTALPCRVRWDCPTLLYTVLYQNRPQKPLLTTSVYTGMPINYYYTHPGWSCLDVQGRTSPTAS